MSEKVVARAIEAREQMKLRQAPLLLVEGARGRVPEVR
jgi:hypothetical protein